MKHDRLIAAALQAQRKVVFSWMLDRYAGGGRKIAEWNDHRYGLCAFGASAVANVQIGLNTDTIRRKLHELCREGCSGLAKDERFGRHAQFKFPREVCDRFAKEAVEYYRAQGYSTDEIR